MTIATFDLAKSALGTTMPALATPRIRWDRTLGVSVAVGVIGYFGGALATDSAHYDLLSGQVGTRNKLVATGALCAALTGVSDHAGHDFLDDLSQAVGVGTDPTGVLEAFLSSAGPHLGSAFQAWRTVTGGTLRDEQFMQVLILGRHDRRPALVEARFAVVNGRAAFDPVVYRPDRTHMKAVAIGAIEPIVTELAWYGSAQPVSGSGFPDPPARARIGLRSSACARLASALVTRVIADDAHLPRPPAYPPHAPVAAMPVNIARL